MRPNPGGWGVDQDFVGDRFLLVRAELRLGKGEERQQGQHDHPHPVVPGHEQQSTQEDARQQGHIQRRGGDDEADGPFTQKHRRSDDSDRGHRDRVDEIAQDREVEFPPNPGGDEASECRDQQDVGYRKQRAHRYVHVSDPALNGEEESGRGEVSDQNAGPKSDESKARGLGPDHRGDSIHHEWNATGSP